MNQENYIENIINIQNIVLLSSTSILFDASAYNLCFFLITNFFFNRFLNTVDLSQAVQVLMLNSYICISLRLQN